MFIKSAIDATGGDVSDVNALRAELEKVNYSSVRGEFTMGPNHFPIQNFYSREVVVDEDGVWTTSAGEAVLKNHQDVYAQECSM